MPEYTGGVLNLTKPSMSNNVADDIPALAANMQTIDDKVSSMDSDLTDITNQLSFPATNLIDGGNFANTAGWEGPNVTVSASNNTLFVTGNGNSANDYVDKLTSIVCGNNHKIYIRGLFTVTNAVCQGLNIYCYGSSGGGAYLTTSPAVSNPVQNHQYPISGILDTSSFAGNLVIRLSNYYVDAATANGKVMEVQYLSAIDLTATFDAALVPTKPSEMDSILSKFPNSWFDGTVNPLLNHKETVEKVLLFDFPSTNIVFNGGHNKGTSGWGANDCTISATSNEMICTYLLVSGYAGTFQFPILIAGHKYYIGADIYPKYARTVHMSLDNTYLDFPTPVVNSWNHYSFTATAVTNGAAPLTLYHDVSAQYAAGDTWKFRNVIAIDLTATFDAAKEPTKSSEMYNILSKFPNEWFDGTVNLFNAKDICKLYAEKADKVQEDWITPTLVNGWTEVSGYPVRYMKDQFGFVHMRGIINAGIVVSIAFIFPVGYRPSDVIYKCAAHDNTNGIVRCRIEPTGSVYIEGSYTSWVDVSEITFKAEA